MIFRSIKSSLRVGFVITNSYFFTIKLTSSLSVRTNFQKNSKKFGNQMHYVFPYDAKGLDKNNIVKSKMF